MALSSSLVNLTRQVHDSVPGHFSALLTGPQTPVRKWQTADIQSITIEKSKHVHIDIGGSSPTNLHFSTGSKDTAEAIVAKLESSKQSSGSPSSSNAATSTISPTPSRRLPPIDGKLHKKKASVHFSPASPVVIPPREPSEEEEPDPETDGYRDSVESSSQEKGELATALYDFEADGDDELSVKEDEEL